MSASTLSREFVKGLIDRAIGEEIRYEQGKRRRAFLDLLRIVQAKSDLLRPSSFGYPADERQLRGLIHGLFGLSRHRHSWRRPAGAWEPRGKGVLVIFSSLAHHLLASYPVPLFLLRAWFEDYREDWGAHQAWFLKLARGEGLRAADFPIPLGRRMIHEFTRTPTYLTIQRAVRRAQVLGLGGTEDLAMALARSNLGIEYGNEDFWSTVIRFLINQGRRLDIALIPEILRALHYRKFEPIRVRIGEDEVIELDPPQPDLSLKGWTLASLLRRIPRWKAKRERAYRRRVIHWERLGIGECRAKDEEDREWTIRELLDSEALVAEGEAMNHCVASYSGHCALRRASIWSLGIEGEVGRKRVLTIEVSPGARQVVQAKMNSNEDPDDRCMHFLNDWADREGLTVQLS